MKDEVCSSSFFLFPQIQRVIFGILKVTRIQISNSGKL